MKQKLILKYTRYIVNLQSWCDAYGAKSSPQYKAIEKEIAIYEKFIQELISL